MDPVTISLVITMVIGAMDIAYRAIQIYQLLKA